MNRGPFKVETHEGAPLYAGDAQIVVRSRAVQLALPWGGLIWNRPLAVHVRRPEMPEQILPVRDVTRLAQIMIVVAGLIAGLALGSLLRARGE